MVEPVVLTAPTEMDAEAAPAFRDEVAFDLAAGVDRVVIDMAAVRFIDSSGIGALVAVAKRAEALGIALTIRNVGPNPAATLRVSGTMRVLPIER